MENITTEIIPHKNEAITNNKAQEEIITFIETVKKALTNIAPEAFRGKNFL
jgi:hypothetical protein